MDICSNANVGLVDWLTHCDKHPAKKMENSEARKKLVGRKFYYSRSRVGTRNLFVSKDDKKVNNSLVGYSKGLNPNAPIFTPRGSVTKSVSTVNTTNVSSRPPPLAPSFLHSKSIDRHSYNVETKNRFAALDKIDEFEDTNSSSHFEKNRASQDRSGKRDPLKNKKPDLAKKAASKPMAMMDTVLDMPTLSINQHAYTINQSNSSTLNPESSVMEKKVYKDHQVCKWSVIYLL